MSGVGITGEIKPLNGGNFPVWEDIDGKGGYRTVVDIAARDALLTASPLFLKEGMLVYVQSLQIVYELLPSLTSWIFFLSSPALASQATWFVDGVLGSDTNDGKAGNPLRSMTELKSRLNPNGAEMILTQNVVVNVTFNAGAGTGTFIRAGLKATTNSATSNFTLSIVGSITSSAPITLTGVTPSNAPTVRGELVTAAGNFIAKERIRVTSGAAVGAIAYSTGLNGSAQDTFFNEFVVPTVAGFHIPKLPAIGDTVVVDTLTVKFFQCEFSGSEGAIVQVTDIQIQRFEASGADLNTPSADDGGNVVFSGCQMVSTVGVGGTVTSGGACLFGCRVVAGGLTTLNGNGWLLWGCVVQGLLTLSSCQAASYGLSIDGGQLVCGISYQGVTGGSVSNIKLNSSFNGNGALEVENGPNASGPYGAAVTISSGSSIEYVGPAWGISGSYAVGFYHEAGAWSYVKGTLTTIGDTFKVPSTTNFIFAGLSFAYSNNPIVLRTSNCGVVLTSSPSNFGEASVYLANQSTNLAAASVIATPYVGTYTFSGYVTITTPGTSGVVTLNAIFTDKSGVSRTVAVASTPSIIAAGGVGGSPITLETNGSPIQFSITGIITPGALQYSFTAICFRNLV